MSAPRAGQPYGRPKLRSLQSHLGGCNSRWRSGGGGGASAAEPSSLPAATGAAPPPHVRAAALWSSSSSSLNSSASTSTRGTASSGPALPFLATSWLTLPPTWGLHASSRSISNGSSSSYSSQSMASTPAAGITGGHALMPVGGAGGAPRIRTYASLPLASITTHSISHAHASSGSGASSNSSSVSLQGSRPTRHGEDPLPGLKAAAGTWVKDKALSDPMGPALEAMAIGGVVRQAVKLVKGMKLTVEEGGTGGTGGTGSWSLAVFSVISWFKVTEKYPLDGSPSRCKRRDLRKGGHVGRLMPGHVGPHGGFLLDLQWSEPHGGRGCDEFVLAPAGTAARQAEARQQQQQGAGAGARQEKKGHKGDSAHAKDPQQPQHTGHHAHGEAAHGGPGHGHDAQHGPQHGEQHELHVYSRLHLDPPAGAEPAAAAAAAKGGAAASAAHKQPRVVEYRTVYRRG